MIQDISFLRTQIEQFLQSRSSSHARFPSELKTSILEHARSQRIKKVSRGDIASELGLSVTTLHGWLYAKHAKSKLKPVVVSSAAHSVASVVLITRDGHRVEGLDVDGMSQLLRGLS